MYSVELTRSSLPTSRVSHNSSSLLEYATVLYRPSLVLALDIIVYYHLLQNYRLSTIANKISTLYLSEVYYGIVYNIFSYFLVIFFRFFYIDFRDIGPRKVDPILCSQNIHFTNVN
jgi:hypothetical protein